MALFADIRVSEGFREVTKNNLPILLAFWPVFFVAAIGEYSNMHRLPRLEYEPKFGAIMGRLFFVTSLNPRNIQYMPVCKIFARLDLNKKFTFSVGH